MKQKIDFSYDWNKKLGCDCFTTLRLSDRFKVGDLIDVSLKNTFLFIVEVIAKKEIQNIDLINEFIARIDTGYSATECKKLLKTMYKNHSINWTKQYIYLYLIKKTNGKKI